MARLERQRRFGVKYDKRLAATWMTRISAAVLEERDFCHAVRVLCGEIALPAQRQTLPVEFRHFNKKARS
jgi:hypothetical protein